jgi:hypothetical protein
MRQKRPEWFKTYEEKPVCSRCGTSITGTVLRTLEVSAPICRKCAFEIKGPYRRSRDVTDEKPVLTPEEIRNRNILISCLALATAVLLWRAYVLAPLFKPEQPLRHGTYQTNPSGDKCIKNLWVLSARLQQAELPEALPGCPSSGMPYRVDKSENDTIISCPTPGEHLLDELSVSYDNPVPRAAGWREE